MRLLHTADVHLDAPNGQLGARAADLRERTWAAFERAIDEALARQVQLFIIAGDLFDRRDPPPQTVARALRQIMRLTAANPPIDVLLLPGTHDCWTATGGLWDAPWTRTLPEEVHLLAAGGPVTARLPHLDAAVHGCAHRCDERGQRPVCTLRADEAAAINIGVAHGSYERGDVEDAGSAFSDPEIAATGMDYLALGHWHSWLELRAGEVIAVNPGSPEVPGFGSWARGSVAVVTLGGGPAQVERVEVGSLYAEQVTLDVGDLSGTEDLIGRLEQRADPDLLLHVRLGGLASPGMMIDADAASERLRDAFFALRVSDASHPALDSLAEARLDERMTLGRFVALARERIEAAQGDERQERIAERALQIGVSMLRQRNEGERR
jgi:exonuclease SbcD